MPGEFAEWLRKELAARRLSQRDLARRAGMPRSGVNQILHGKTQPTWQSIVKIAGGLGQDPVPLLRSEGMLPDLGPESTDEEEAVRILRALPFHLRQVAVWMLRGIHAEYARGDRQDTRSPTVNTDKCGAEKGRREPG
jgi:transcriptional regulator with XRE-family HTH domain